MSPFMAQELLYDYATQKLDPERTQAVKEYIQSSKEAQFDLQRIISGLQYADRLADTHLTQTLMAQVKAPSTYLQILHQKMRIEDWSPGIKMGLEVLVVAVLIISVSMLIPWHKLMEINWSISRDVILAEVERKNHSADEGDGAAVAPATADTSQVFTDEASGKVKPLEAKVTTDQTISAITPNVAGNSVAVTAKAVPAPQPAQVVAAKVVETQAPAAKTAAAAKTPEAKAKEDSGAAQEHKGYLYRGSIILTNVQATTPKFLEKIKELGGRKAGEVELGWKKGSSSYFHMTIPESKYSALLDFAKEYGEFKISKEKHERVMPEGIIRIIFTIDEKKEP